MSCFVESSGQLEMVETEGETLEIKGLETYTNYSVTVSAFTRAGKGKKSAQVFCQTAETGKLKKSLLHSQIAHLDSYFPTDFAANLKGWQQPQQGRGEGDKMSLHHGQWDFFSRKQHVRSLGVSLPTSLSKYQSWARSIPFSPWREEKSHRATSKLNTHWPR